jgi:hypothetical protein
MIRKTIIFEDHGPVAMCGTWPWPHRHGAYRYLPYRSGSRVRMYRTIEQGGSARCYYLREGRKVSFSVVGGTTSSKLQLAHFEFHETPVA